MYWHGEKLTHRIQADKRLATTPEEALAATDPNDDHGIAEEKEKKSVIEQEQQEEKKRDNNVEEEDDDDDDDDDERPKRGDGGDVLDTREHLNVVFMGHVDAGKSTISGMLETQNIIVNVLSQIKTWYRPNSVHYRHGRQSDCREVSEGGEG